MCECSCTSGPANTSLCLLQLSVKACCGVCDNLISAQFWELEVRPHVHAWSNRDGDKQSLGKAGSEMARGELQSYIAENKVHRQTMKVGDKGIP